jgi:hypothetical protein
LVRSAAGSAERGDLTWLRGPVRRPLPGVVDRIAGLPACDRLAATKAEPVAAEATGAVLLPGCRTGGAPLITAARGPCRAYRFRGFGDSK